MAGHTPGPWVAIKINERWSGSKPLYPDGTWHILPKSDVERISICETCQGDDTDAETRKQAEYDARLIAAAPELLEALEDCAEDLAAEVEARYRIDAGTIHPAMHTKYDRDMEPVRNARAIIAKAKGVDHAPA